MKLSIKSLVCALACTGLFLSCSNDYNPFIDPSNALVVVKHKSFRDVDTIGIFATETLTVAVSARDLVDSFSISTTNNRLFSDSSIKEDPGSVIPPKTFTFYLSFSDTGWQKVTISTFRKNNDKVSRDYSLFCTSPLHQNDISGNYGDSVVLNTNPVSDADVIYHWDFGGGMLFEKTRPTARVLIASFLSGKSGFLWVSDNLGKNNSPKAQFSFSLKDTSGPMIVCVNNNVRNDTVQTGDSTFTFLARIIDLQNTTNISALVNGQQFDFFDDKQNVYVKIFYGVAVYRPASPLLMRIKATDIFNNLSEKVFYVVYNTDVGRISGPVILIKSPSLDINRIATSSTKEKFIFGSIENYSTQPFDVLMRLRVNGVLQSKVDTLPATYSGLWNFNTSLNEGANPMTVIAYTTNGDSCAGQSFTVIYNPTSQKNDTTPPVILDISAGGRQNFFTTSDSLLLRIIAVDEGTGIQSMTVNGTPINSSPEGKGYIWYDAVKAVHSRTEGLVRILATDSGGHATDTSVYVYKNRLPQIVVKPNPPDPLVAGTTYRDKIIASDPDNDTVLVTKISGPAAMTVSSNGAIEWTPALSDTGRNLLILGIFDGFQPQTYACTLFVAAPTGPLALPVRFATTLMDFPAYLEVGKDSLRVALHTVNGTAPLELSVLVVTTATAISVQDSVMRWDPALADTGLVRLMVTVIDERKTADTLLPAVLVVPPNRPFTLSVSFKSPVTVDGALDMSKATAPDTLRFIIQDPDDPLVERHTVRIIQSHTETVSTVDSSQSFMVILDPGRVSASLLKDTLKVVVTDRAGHADSIAFGIMYHTVPVSKRIVMNTTAAGGGAAVLATITKFPMLVRLDRTNFDFSVVNMLGSPLGFKKPDGTLLPYEIERWDSLNGQAEIWVLVDTVFGNDSVHSITMTMDPAGLAPQSNSAAVFDTANGFQGVWHFGEATNYIAVDATANAYNGTPTASTGIPVGPPGGSVPTDTTGVIGHAKAFDGQAGYFAMSNTAAGKLNFPRGGPFTTSAWVNTHVLDANFYCIVSKGNNQYALQIADDNQWEIMDFDNLLGWQHVRSPAVVQAWKYVAGVVNGANQYLYVDGVLANTIITSQQSTGRIVSNSVNIGKMSESATRFFNGKIDEVRMANVPRSGDWIKLCYENQKPGSGFITFKQ
jgi:Domain of unknown function (DUF2341).